MAHIPIGTRYTSTVEGTLTLDFVCSRCGAMSSARVKAKGEGEATAYAFIGGDRAKAKASVSADEDLRRSAALLARIAPCPSCGFVDEAVRSSLRSSAFMRAIGVVGASVALAIFLPERAGILSSFLPVLGVLVALFDYHKQSWRWSEARERVEFLRGAPGHRKKKRQADRLRPAFAWGETLDEAELTWPFAPSLHLGVLTSVEDDLSWVSIEDLGELSDDDAKAKALANLERVSASGLVLVEPGVFRGQWNDQLAAARLALPELARTLSVAGTPVAFTPSEDTFFVAGLDEPRALERAFELSKKDLERVLGDDSSAGRFTAHPWILTGQGWQPWSPPPGHALQAKIALLDAQLGAAAWRPG